MPSSRSQPCGYFSFLLEAADFLLDEDADERFLSFFLASLAERSRRREKVFALVEK